MIIKVYSFIAFYFVISLAGYAQNSIFGKVLDSENNDALEGVNIVIDQFNTGTTTNEDGLYTINNLPSGELIIKFSYIGYNTEYRTVFLEDSNLEINVQLTMVVIEGQEVVISGNFTSTQHDNTVKISTLKAKTLLESPAQSLVEAIAEVPGVSIISKGPGIGTPVIRGLSLSNVLFLVNGIPMQNYQFSENHPYMVDENGVKQIEIIKGPSALIYGSGAVGGIINIIDEPIPPNNIISGSLTTKYFSNSSGIQSNIDIKGSKNNFIFGIRGGINSHQDYYQGNNKRAPNTRFNRNNTSIDLGYIAKKASFLLSYQNNNDKLGLLVQPAISLVTSNGRKNEVWFQNLNNNLFISKNKVYLGKVKLELDLSYQNNRRRLLGTPDTPDYNLVDMTLKTYTARFKTIYNLNSQLKFIFGFQGFLQNNSNSDAPEHVLPDATIFELSYYTLAQYSLNEALVFEAGIRTSYSNITVPRQESSDHDHKTIQAIDEEYIEYSGDFSNISFSIGSKLKLSDKTLIRLNFASAYRNPNIAELTQNGKHGTRYEIGNPNLVTQQNTEGDIGLHFHSQHTSADLSIFYNNIHNYIYLSPTNDTTDDGEKIYQYKQTPSYLYGGEAMLHIHPHPVDWLHLKTSYSYVIGKQKDGEFLPAIPAQRINFEAKVIIKDFKSFSNLFVSGSLEYVFAQNNPSIYEVSSDSYNLINMGLGSDFLIGNKLATINFNISNLFNTSYISHLSTLKDLNIQNMGRSFNISFKLPLFSSSIKD